jgi:PHD/YefM family antitoxin component YafN of YafNO toxin-antitoxin module
MLSTGHIDKKTVSEFISEGESLIHRIHKTKKPLLLTEEGENAAVILDSNEYDQIAERLQMLEDIYAAQDQLRSGSGISHEEAKKKLISRYGG